MYESGELFESDNENADDIKTVTGRLKIKAYVFAIFF